MNDRLLVEALRERALGAPAAVYDAHARGLYAYCWFRLRCRDAAQVALRDTFIVAEAHVGRLRDPDRFRTWLYAIARLECTRRQSPRTKTPDVPVAHHDQEDVERRITAWQAVSALRPISREILDLRVRRRLSVPDLAAVLGISLQEAQEALDLAHRELAETLTAEILAQQGPYGCPERALLLRERRGELTHDLSGRLTEHARSCSVCGPFRLRSVSAQKVYGLLPEVHPPADLRLRVMSCFLDPELVGYRLFAATRVAEFTPKGFPIQSVRSGQQARPGRFSGIGRFRRAPSASVAGLGASVIRATTVLAVVGLLSGGGVASMYGFVGTGRNPAEGGADAHPTAVPGVSQMPKSGRPSATHTDGPGTLQSAPVSATFPLGARASSAPLAAVPLLSPDPDSGTEPIVAAPCVLTVSPLYLDMAGSSDGSVDLRAGDGTVAWQAKTRGPIRVQPSYGHLQPGQNVTVRVHVSRQGNARGSGLITFRPCGPQVQVTWRQNAPDPEPTPTPTGSAPASPTTTPGTQPPDTTHPAPSSAPVTSPSSSTEPEPTPSPTGRSSGSTYSSPAPATTG